jgi:hypothetical protein
MGVLLPENAALLLNAFPQHGFCLVKLSLFPKRACQALRGPKRIGVFLPENAALSGNAFAERFLRFVKLTFFPQNAS